eukprot:GHVO01053150.1.p1 GENE.GHVO01053150.1~~GHVO01053150.1.p1  ORF type:complete len:410 (-),score=27.98 GHVO01053150.1:333-1382(-)
METRQSAYRSGHSTETALLSIQDEILCAVGEGDAVLLVLLDLSAAFDTVHHGILLSEIERQGITGAALNWFRSYLTDRSQATHVGSQKSQPTNLSCGVPQGSVLGPVLFTLYTSSLGELLREKGVSYHLYADDTQLWIRCKPQEPHDAITQMESCIAAVKSWMTENLLKMNNEKTEFLVISSKQMQKRLVPVHLHVGGADIQPSARARNLGVLFNQHATMETQISSVCRSAYLQLRCLRRIQKYIDNDALESLVHAFITSKIDYCNSLYIGTPKHQLQRLQRIQNCAARLLVGAERYEHITPILKYLHWLPVDQRVIFKILLLVFKAANNIGPVYLREKKSTATFHLVP